ncbi:hypothetical protein KJ980_01080 [Patescibacteria group bacterium]|nr:hypothetical protein [Patescibacteria group bacterium]MBU4098223.1 hypothetical protein [Patescibacteria group bacterium]
MKKQTAQNALTKEELKDILKDYPRKNDLDQRFIASQNAFRAEIKYEFSMMKEEILAGMSKFTNLILTAIDPLLKEIETRREDREIGTAQMEEAKNRLNNHEKRITKPEHS